MLKELFNKLELDNLQMIHQQQELEQSYEDLLGLEAKKKLELTQLYDEQNKTRVELKAKIDISQSILTSLRKKTTDGFIYEAGAVDVSNSGVPQKGQPKLVPVDFAALLSKIRRRIIETHMKNINHGEVENKPTLSLLNVSAIDN